MELVYLWVEDYKNIHEQGFNFSPKFNCHYDVKTNKLTIDENDDHIENFFGDNINVTAIVGKNGSGKSSVLEYIIQYTTLFLSGRLEAIIYPLESIFLLYYNKSLDTVNILWSANNNITISNRSSSNVRDRLSIFKTDKCLNLLRDKEYEELTNLSFENRINNQTVKDELIENIKAIKKEVFLLFYDYSFNKFAYYDYSKEKSVSLSVPNKNNDLLLNINYEKTLIAKHILNRQYIGQNDYFEPKSVFIEIPSFIYQLGNFNSTNMLNYIRYLIEYTIIHELKDNHTYVIKNYNEIIMTPEAINKFIVDNYDNLHTTYIKSDMKHIPLSYDLENLFNYYDILNKYKDIKLFNKDDTFSRININIQELTESNLELLQHLPSKFFHLKLSSTKLEDYDDLSNGEKSALRLRYYIEDIITRSKKNSYILLLDEPNNDFHPDWQQKLLSYLISIFQNRKEKLHFIITTHSPFLLSDIPKQNIIFLDKDKDGKCIVVDGLKEKKQTFGANIHTLLSDSFFMEDGLMGEFAKGKINKIIRFLNGKNKFIDFPIEQIEKVINTIGEPFLKSKLLDMYNRKFIYEYKIREQKRIDEQIRILQEKREKL